MIDEMTDGQVSVTLVNVNQLEARRVVVQAWGYAEHSFTSVKIGEKMLPLDSPNLTVELAPASGARLTLGMKRYVNKPTMAFPWN